MYCQKCGQKAEDGQTNCAKCGSILIPADNTASSSIVESIIPTKNPNALYSYYLGVFSLIPFIGLFLGVAALVTGFKGIKYSKENPGIAGIGHAYAGIILGVLGLLISAGFIWLLVWGLGPRSY